MPLFGRFESDIVLVIPYYHQISRCSSLSLSLYICTTSSFSGCVKLRFFIHGINTLAMPTVTKKARKNAINILMTIRKTPLFFILYQFCKYTLVLEGAYRNTFP